MSIGIALCNTRPRSIKYAIIERAVALIRYKGHSP